MTGLVKLAGFAAPGDLSFARLHVDIDRGVGKNIYDLALDLIAEHVGLLDCFLAANHQMEVDMPNRAAFAGAKIMSLDGEAFKRIENLPKHFQLSPGELGIRQLKKRFFHLFG